MNIHLIMYAYALDTMLLENFYAANDPEFTWHIFRHSTTPSVVAACDSLAELPNVNYYPYGTNRGLARSCNEGIIAAQSMGADVVVQLCDDIAASPTSITALASATYHDTTCAFSEINVWVERVGRVQSAGFDIAAINLHAIDVIGYFDVNCWPVNFEDKDWERRALLSGFHAVTLPDMGVVHRDANTEQDSAGTSDTFMRNRDYYIAKHGGDAGKEQYTVPFNDTRYDLTIPFDRIDNPYPEHKRSDI